MRKQPGAGCCLSEGHREAYALIVVRLLISLLDRADPEHETCVATLKTLRDPLITVWPAFAEAMYLLGRSWPAQKAVWSRLETEALALAPLDELDAPRMRELMDKYRDLPTDLADAALVRVAERESLTDIFTLDRKHFHLPPRTPPAILQRPSVVAATRSRCGEPRSVPGRDHARAQ